MKNIRIVVVVFFTIIQVGVEAQKDTINISNNDLIMSNLTSSKDQYLVYISSGERILMSSIWYRNTKHEKLNGKDVVVFSQKWTGYSKRQEREIFSISDAKNFAPIYHYTKSRGNVIEAFNFKKNVIKGADSVKNNSQDKFLLSHKILTLNWELDMEVFKTLDYKVGKTFVINFYHPGSKKGPKFYEYKVTGEQTLKGVNGDIDCWVMKIDFGTPKRKGSVQTFWIDKKGKAVVKMHEVFARGSRYKLKIGSLI